MREEGLRDPPTCLVTLVIEILMLSMSISSLDFPDLELERHLFRAHKEKCLAIEKKQA
jgi:hypothetical protein